MGRGPVIKWDGRDRRRLIQLYGLIDPMELIMAGKSAAFAKRTNKAKS
jgi:hypothetical protein